MTYDARQMGAVLVQCVQCLRDWFMTEPQDVCIACRRKVYSETRKGEYTWKLGRRELMPRKAHACSDCGKPCWGKRCSVCAHRYGLRNYTKAGERTTVCVEDESWWIVHRSDFYAVAHARAEKMDPRSHVNYRPRYSEAY